MNTRHTLRVTCKCALYTPDGSKVLLAQYGPQDYGIPGGHMESDESPEDAMRRELEEEIGITGIELTRRDFWMHANGKLILGYTGTLSEETPLTIQFEEVSDMVWVPVADIASGAMKVSSYGEFICQFQPKNSTVNAG
jgi:8-oxo-dGTP pyrophosphatase MutT (NUDIX family)